jgi:hypothetical protein
MTRRSFPPDRQSFPGQRTGVPGGAEMAGRSGDMRLARAEDPGDPVALKGLLPWRETAGSRPHAGLRLLELKWRLFADPNQPDFSNRRCFVPCDLTRQFLDMRADNLE